MRTHYYIEPRSVLVRTAAGLLALSIALRLAWCLGWPGQLAGSRLYLHALLPLASCGLFLLCLMRFGRTRLWLSFFPAFLGVLFFLLKAASFSWLHRLLCTLLYLAVAVFGVAPIRKLLIPLFGLPLAYHIFVEDLILHRAVYTAAQWLQEGSVLCIMASLLCISLAMQEQKPAES